MKLPVKPFRSIPIKKHEIVKCLTNVLIWRVMYCAYKLLHMGKLENPWTGVAPNNTKDPQYLDIPFSRVPH